MTSAFVFRHFYRNNEEKKSYQCVCTTTQQHTIERLISIGSLATHQHKCDLNLKISFSVTSSWLYSCFRLILHPPAMDNYLQLTNDYQRGIYLLLQLKNKFQLPYELGFMATEVSLSSQTTLCALCCFLTLCIQIVLLHNNNNNNSNNNNYYYLTNETDIPESHTPTLCR